MLDYTYFRGWDQHLVPTEGARDATTQMLLQCTELNKLRIRDFVQGIIECSFNLFDADDSLYGLFNAMRVSQNAMISPFVATHDYSVKIRNAKLGSDIKATISPIYHLGPDFIEQYKTKNGKALDNKAVIGLITPENQSNPRKAYSLGIDAGVAFAHSKINHNKSIMLSISEIKDRLNISLSCEGQTMSKPLSWHTLGLKNLPKPVTIQKKASGAA